METERGEEVELEGAAIDIVDCDRAGENQHLVGSPAQRDICFVDKSEADKKYRKIVSVLKKQSLSKAINEEVVNISLCTFNCHHIVKQVHVIPQEHWLNEIRY